MAIVVWRTTCHPAMRKQIATGSGLLRASGANRVNYLSRIQSPRLIFSAKHFDAARLQAFKSITQLPDTHARNFTDRKMADKKKVCVIIGYGPGVGKAIADKWSKEGFSCALVSRTASKLEEACKTIPNSHPFPCDVTDTEALTACLGAIENQLGEVDHLMYNAGNALWKTYDEISQAEMEQAMKINVYSLLAATQIVCPKMEARGDGFVCVTGATASLRGVPFTSAFAAAKAGQRSLVQSIARQLWKKNVHVCLGVIDGQIGDEEKKITPKSIANEYWHLSTQTSDAFAFQAHIQSCNSDMSLL